MIEKNGFKILIVDDNALFREALKRIIREHFPEISFLETTKIARARQLIAARKPRLIMLGLDGSNGFDLAREIRANQCACTLVVITGDDLPEYEAAAYNNGADYFISKLGRSRGQIIVAIADALAQHARTWHSEQAAGNNQK